jgi:hypothetical protein
LPRHTARRRVFHGPGRFLPWLPFPWCDFRGDDGIFGPRRGFLAEVQVMAAIAGAVRHRGQAGVGPAQLPLLDALPDITIADRRQTSGQEVPVGDNLESGPGEEQAIGIHEAPAIDFRAEP